MQFLLTILLVFILVDVLIVGYVVYKRGKKKLPEKVIKKIQKNWKEIIRQGDHRHAIMDADKLLDFALGELGYSGNLGAKLKKAGPVFSSANKVWAAHKIRNNIAHQINYTLDEKTYKNAMVSFKQAFKDLKIF